MNLIDGEEKMQATLVFMAAGFGSRFGGIKQIQPIGPNGEVLMDYAVHDAIAAGFDRIIFIIRKDFEKDFRDCVGKRIEKKCVVEYAFQDITDLPTGFKAPENRCKPWGTGHALLSCRKLIDGVFCALNADDYYGKQAFADIHRFITSPQRDAKRLELCMAGFVLENTLSESGTVTRGVCESDGEGRLLKIHERRGIFKRGDTIFADGERGGMVLNGASPVSMNIWGMPALFIDYLQEGFPRFLRSMPENDLTAEYLLPDVVGDMIRRGEGSVRVLPTADRWFGMTYQQDIACARGLIADLIARGEYPRKL